MQLLLLGGSAHGEERWRVSFEGDTGMVERTLERARCVTDMGKPLVVTGAGHHDGEVRVGLGVLGPSEPATPLAIGTSLFDRGPS